MLGEKGLEVYAQGLLLCSFTNIAGEDTCVKAVSADFILKPSSFIVRSSTKPP
jgi:hypothetical protein